MRRSDIDRENACEALLGSFAPEEMMLAHLDLVVESVQGLLQILRFGLR